MDLDPSHLRNALSSGCHPSPELRERLPELLGLPLTDLFTTEALEKPYTGPRGAYQLARATSPNREELVAAGREAARRHRRQRGLSETVTEPGVLSEIASMLRPTVSASTKRNQ